MTVRQPLFQENDTADQNADIARLLLSALFQGHGGIMSETAFKVSQRAAGANNSVDVAAGPTLVLGTEAALQGAYYISNDATVNIKQPVTADTVNPRIDTIIIQARDAFYSGANNDGAIIWVPGEPAITPVPPDLDALGLENYYKLANIAIAVNDNTVTSGDITDLRLGATASQGRATCMGGIYPCTSTTRPALPGMGMAIWESDTKKWLINEGTDVAPSWIVYGESGLAQWTNYAPQFPLKGAYTTYGRYTRRGKFIFGVAGFRLISGTGDVTSTVQCRLPVTAANPSGAVDLIYLAGGRAFDSTGLFQGVHWSCAASIEKSSILIVKFATAGTPWNATTPFNWGSGANIYQKADHLTIAFCYEAAT